MKRVFALLATASLTACDGVFSFPEAEPSGIYIVLALTVVALIAINLPEKLMKNLLIAIALLFSVSACSTTGFVSAISVSQTAPQAESILLDYIGDDEITLNQLEGPLAVLRAVYDGLKDVDSGTDLIDFFSDETNQYNYGSAAGAWNQIINIVQLHQERTGDRVPKALYTFRTDVQAVYSEILEAVKKQERGKQIQMYVGLLIKLIAAVNGKIV